MKRFRFIVKIALGFALALPALAEPAKQDLLHRVGARLATDTAVDQRFVQEKQLKILKKPIRTEGVMLYRKTKGVCWHTEKPVASTLMLGEEELRQINSGGEVVFKAQQQPALFGFTRLFFAALSGQVETLGEHFQLQASGTEQQWSLQLAPKDELLRKFIAAMELHGGARVDRVRVTGRDGDITTIVFAPLDSADPTLEQRCFGR